MLPRAHRLRRSGEFACVVRRGTRTGTRAVVLHCLTRPDTDPVRVGFVVGKRVGKAVVRNKVRRRLRALLADRVGLVPAHSSVVVRANPFSAAATWDDLAADVDSCLARLAARRAPA